MLSVEINALWPSKDFHPFLLVHIQAICENTEQIHFPDIFSLPQKDLTKKTHLFLLSNISEWQVFHPLWLTSNKMSFVFYQSLEHISPYTAIWQVKSGDFSLGVFTLNPQIFASLSDTKSLTTLQVQILHPIDGSNNQQ